MRHTLRSTILRARHASGGAAFTATLLGALSASAYSSTTATISPIAKVPLPTSSSIVQPAPPVSTVDAGASTTGATAGTEAAPTRSFDRTTALGHSFGNAHFGASYSAGLAFFGGRTATLVPIGSCKPTVPSSANDYETDTTCIDWMEDRIAAADRLYDACVASGLGGIEYCMTNSAFRAAHSADVAKLSLDMEERILSTNAWLSANATVLGVNASLVDIRLAGRSSAESSPVSTIHYFQRGQQTYDSSGPGSRSFDKTVDAVVFEQSKVLMVGGAIPMTLHVEVDSHFGTLFQASATGAATSVGVTPHARYDGTGDVSLDLGLYKGGVQLVLELLDVQVPSNASLVRTNLATSDKLTWAINCDLTLHSLAGKVQLFGKPIWRSQYDYLTLIDWDGFGTTIPIYHAGADAFVKKPL